MTYHAKTNTYTCNVCGISGLTKGQVMHPMAHQHRCWDCKNKPFQGAPRVKSPADDPKRVLADRGTATPDIYYRRLSSAEFQAITKNSRLNPAAALDYNNTTNYRLWFSTSQAKCEAFGNENNTDAGEVYRLTFKPGFSAEIRKIMAPHQMQGIQNAPDRVAYHREGFVQLGNVTTMSEMNNLLDANKHHNVGFTQNQGTLLNQQIQRIDKM